MRDVECLRFKLVRSTHSVLAASGWEQTHLFIGINVTNTHMVSIPHLNWIRRSFFCPLVVLFRHSMINILFTPFPFVRRPPIAVHIYLRSALLSGPKKYPEQRQQHPPCAVICGDIKINRVLICRMCYNPRQHNATVGKREEMADSVSHFFFFLSAERQLCDTVETRLDVTPSDSMMWGSTGNGEAGKIPSTKSRSHRHEFVSRHHYLAFAYLRMNFIAAL